MLPGQARLTERGWYALSSLVLMVVLGALFGVEELYALASACGAVLITAAGWLAYWGHCGLTETTTIRAIPLRSSPAGKVVARFSLANTRRRRTAAAVVSVALNRVGPSGSLLMPGAARAVSFALPRLASGAHAEVAVEIPPLERGIWRAGPLVGHILDPLVLAEKRWAGVSSAVFVVHPKMQVLDFLPPLASARTLGAVRKTFRAQGGDEVHGVREYHDGDDERRIHWRATARWDRLMVREDEGGGECRVCLGVDLRASCQTEEVLDRSLEAAASIASAVLARRGNTLRLTTTDGQICGPGSGPVARSATLDVMAAASRHRSAPVAPLLGGPADLAVLVSPTSSAADELLAHERVGSLCPLLLVLTYEAPLEGEPAAALRRGQFSPAPVIVVKAGLGLRRPWALAVRNILPATRAGRWPPTAVHGPIVV